jgi:hypothetical protein
LTLILTVIDEVPLERENLENSQVKKSAAELREKIETAGKQHRASTNEKVNALVANANSEREAREAIVKTTQQLATQSQAQFEETAPLRSSMQLCLANLAETLALNRELIRLKVLKAQKELQQ